MEEYRPSSIPVGIGGTPSELRDIVANLLFNAVDALPRGGTIHIQTQAVEEGVQLTVRDTGIGMNEETRSRVFEPFFTTKADVGSGLGLSTVYGIVRRWGGTITVESQLGKGTLFTLQLPVHTAVLATVVRQKLDRYKPLRVLVSCLISWGSNVGMTPQ